MQVSGQAAAEQVLLEPRKENGGRQAPELTDFLSPALGHLLTIKKVLKCSKTGLFVQKNSLWNGPGASKSADTFWTNTRRLELLTE